MSTSEFNDGGNRVMDQHPIQREEEGLEIQSNLFNTETKGTDLSVLFMEVALL